MKKAQVVLPVMCCAAALSGCAYLQEPSAWTRSEKSVMASINPANEAEAMYRLGRYYQAQEKYDQAIIAYRKALAVDNSFADAHNGLGVVYWLQGKADESLEEFRNAVKKAPGAARFQNNLGYAYYMQGRYADSIASLKEALALEPDNARTVENLQLAYTKSGTKPDIALKSVPAAKASHVMAALNEDSKGEKPDTLIPLVENSLAVEQVAPNIFEIRERPLSAREDSPVMTQAADAPVSAEKDPVAETKPMRLEVSNGNGVNGMAKRFGGYLSKNGYQAKRITNQKPFKTRTTQIQYREGFLEQAKSLQTHMPGNPQLIQRNGIRSDITVRLVLGKDMIGRVAFHHNKMQVLQVASSE